MNSRFIKIASIWQFLWNNIVDIWFIEMILFSFTESVYDVSLR